MFSPRAIVDVSTNLSINILSMKSGTVQFFLILLCVCIPASAHAQTEWGVNEAFSTLVEERGILAVLSVHAKGDRAFVSASLSDFSNRLFYSDDNGGTWTEAASDNNTSLWPTFANADGDVIYSFGFDIFSNRFLRKSTDGGSSWTVQAVNFDNFPTFFGPTHFVAINDTLILTSTARDAGVLKSVDGGANWVIFDMFEDEDDDNIALDEVFSYGDFFYVASRGNGFYRSHRDSTTWDRTRAFGVDEGADDDILGAVVNETTGRVFILTDNGVEYSDDNGDTWTLVTLATLGIDIEGTPQGMEMVGDNILIQFLRQDQANMVLVEGLASSTVVNDGLGEFNSNSRLLSFPTTANGMAYANRLNDATQLWQFGMGVATSNEEDIFTPEEFTLDQNFPNPFNPTTNIRFTLNSASSIQLSVYNLLGQQVATVAQGRFAAGSHTVSFDASSLSSGVYIYQLRAGATLLNRKMTLIK